MKYLLLAECEPRGHSGPTRTVCLAIALFLYYRLPETKGETLEAIETQRRIKKQLENE